MIKKRLKESLGKCFDRGVAEGLWSGESGGTYAVEEPKMASHGDFSTNLAMVVGGREKKNPRQGANQRFENSLCQHIIPL